MPTIVQSATGYASTGTGYNVVFATAPSSGNLLLFLANTSQWTSGAGTGATSKIAGFTRTNRQVQGNNSLEVLTKTAGASEGTTYAVTIEEGSVGEADDHSGIMYEISTAKNSDPFNAIAFSTHAGWVYSVTTASRIPSVIGVLPITVLAADNGAQDGLDLSAPSGFGSVVKAIPAWHSTFSAHAALGTDTTTAFSATWSKAEDGIYIKSPVTAIILINPADGGSPAFTDPPSVTAKTVNSYTLGGTLSEEGHVYAVAVLSTDAAPTTPQQIILGHNGADTAARGAGDAATNESGVFSFDVTGANLGDNPIHDLHVVGRAVVAD